LASAFLASRSGENAMQPPPLLQDVEQPVLSSSQRLSSEYEG
jgi:hypothetical protein